MKKIFVILLAALGVAIPLFFAFATVGTIDSTYKYAWSNNSGWINFGCDNCNVEVTDTALTGYAWSQNLGWINLAPDHSGVVNSNGVLSGSAWGQDAGWIDFNGVSIDGSGNFTGTATGPIVGTVAFSSCGVSCGVKTDWLPTGGGSPPGGGGGAYYFHNVCSNNACVIASGIGTSECSSDADCFTTHQECQNNQCVAVSGSGVNQCSVSADCIQPKHNECQNNQCVAVDGTGSDTCQTASDCVSSSHNECQNNQCVAVAGVGVSQCQASGDCVSPKHNECQNQACIAVSGAGLNLCQTDADCGQAPVILQQHNECQNQKCVSVSGEGMNGCQSDTDCKTVIPVTGTTPSNPVAPIQQTFSGATNLLKTTEGSAVATTVSTLGVVGGIISTISVILFAPGIIFELFFIPFRLMSLLMAVTGIRKKVVHWGVVYDSATKQPLDPVRVALHNLDGKEIASTITDVDGRYGFLVDVGIYKISAQKTHYQFPSKKLEGKMKDEIYENLYFGNQIEIKEKGEVIKLNIPLDSLGFDWNEFAKAHRHLMRFYSQFDLATRNLADTIFALGFVLSIWAFFAAPHPYNVAILVLYLALLALRVFVFKPKSFGSVIKRSDGEPLSFAVLRIVSPSLNVEVGHKVADAFGRYYCLIPKGKYYVKVQEKENDGSYKEVFTSPVIDASKKGIIKKNFKI